MRSRIIAAVAVAAAFFGGSALLPASAVQAPVRTVSAAQDIDGTRIQTGTIYHDQINDTVEADLMKTPAKSVFNSSLNLGIIAKNNLGAAVQRELDFGTVADGNIVNLPSKTVDKIGGPFAANATALGDFTLPAGTWNLFFKVRFDRTVTGPLGTRVQLAVREGTSGEDFGTDMGTEISPTAGRELVKSGVSIVTVTEPTVLTAKAFGYNDDGSASGSGQIAAGVQIWAQLVG